MKTTDPIADFLTRIRNAIQAEHKTVRIPGSKFKLKMANILKEEGYVTDVTFLDEGPQGTIEIFLKYLPNGTSVVTGLKRISTPGRRLYLGFRKIPKVLNGLGISIVSTSLGLMTDYDARRNKAGGEILFEIW